MQATAALSDLLPLLGSAYWINPPVAERRAESKLLQLTMAARVGLDVPATLLSNVPSAVNRFAEDFESELVTKLLEPLSYSMSGGGPTVYTSALEPSDLAALDDVRWSPQLFQPRLAKAQELRAVFVEQEVFAGSIDTSRTARGTVDWRASEPEANVQWRSTTLPPRVAARTQDLLRVLGLRFAAVDFVVEPSGRYVFLELNPGGEWGWLERDLDLPISGAIADCLAREWRSRMDSTSPVPGRTTSIQPGPVGPRSKDGPRVLLISHTSDNECVDHVAVAIADRGGRPLRFDTDRYPLDLQMTTRQRGAQQEHLLIVPGDSLRLDDLTAVWLRRLAIGRELPWSLGDLRAPSIDESRRTFLGTIESLRCFQMDPWLAIRRADSKELQLRWAAECGLETPRTLISNQPGEVRAFFDEVEGRMVTKMQHSFAVYRHGEERVVFTESVTRGDVEDLSGLRFCPMTFQEELDKELEIRVTIVGRRVFAAAVDSQRLSHSRTDWRRAGVELIDAWEPYPLPNDTERALLALQSRLGLNYGAADLVLTPRGGLVFLEVNAVGEFFWLERHAELPISEAIADTLLGRAERNMFASTSENPQERA